MTNEEILEEIKKVITTLHPYMENRLTILLNYPNPSMDIDFFFHPNGTTICFSDGLETKKSSIAKKIELDKHVNPVLINALIELLLQDHDYISNLVKSNDTLVIGTDVTNEYKDNLTLEAACANYEKIVKISRIVLLTAKENIPSD